MLADIIVAIGLLSASLTLVDTFVNQRQKNWISTKLHQIWNASDEMDAAVRRFTQSEMPQSVWVTYVWNFAVLVFGMLFINIYLTFGDFPLPAVAAIIGFMVSVTIALGSYWAAWRWLSLRAAKIITIVVGAIASLGICLVFTESDFMTEVWSARPFDWQMPQSAILMALKVIGNITSRILPALFAFMSAIYVAIYGIAFLAKGIEVFLRRLVESHKGPVAAASVVVVAIGALLKVFA